LLKNAFNITSQNNEDVKKSGEGRQKDRRKMPFGVFCSAKDGKKVRQTGERQKKPNETQQ